MATLTTDYLDIPKGSTWTEIPLTTDSFSLQNTANVLMEYSFTAGVQHGSYLTPYTVLNGIRQSVYVRFNEVSPNGVISITRETI